MRKITEKAVRAFIADENFKQANTKVICQDNKTQMFLHGNLIAEKTKGKIKLSHAGWETRTTKDRLNGILDYLGKSRIYQKNFIWYLNDDKVFDSGWNKINE